MANPSPTSEDPRTVVRLFPLTGSLLLPGVFLPLNVFEPRYLALVRDAQADDRRIGMIQPRVPGPDSRGLGRRHPELYAVGCVGELVRCDPQPDGRFLIVLEGLQRFRWNRELEQRSDYRRVVADCDEFSADRSEPEGELDASLVLGAVQRMADRGDLDLDLDLLASLPGVRLVNSLSVALPFAPAERQGLLEAPTPEDRRDFLMELLTMELEGESGLAPYEPPLVH